MSVLLCLNEGLEFKVLDPKRAQHLSLSATGINQVRWQMFLSYRNQSIDYQCNQLTGFYMRKYCHEKGQ